MPDQSTAVEQHHGQTVAAQDQAAPVPLIQQIDQVMPQLERLGVDPERFARVLLTECRANPRLLECTPASFMGAAFASAQLGLEPGPLQQVWLIPRRNKRQGTTDVQFMIGYRGYVELARRAGVLVTAQTVHANDHFVEQQGTEPLLEHVPNHADPGEAILWYAVARFPDGRSIHRVLNRDEIERRRKMSSTPYKPGSPWYDHYEAMARKTAIRALWSELPADPHIQAAQRVDEQVLTMPTIDGPAVPAIAGSQTTDVQQDDGDPLETASIHELRQACDDAGLPKSGDRAELVDRIRAARGGITSGCPTSPEEDGPARASSPTDPDAAGQGTPGEGRDASAVASAASPGPARDDLPPAPPPPDEPDEPEAAMTEAQRRNLFRLFGEHNIDDEQRKAVVVGHYRVESMNDLSVGQAAKLIDLLETPDGPGQFKAAADDWLAAQAGSDRPPTNDSSATPVEATGAGADGEAAPAPNQAAPEDTPDPEPQVEAEPEVEGPSLQERAHAHALAASTHGQLRARVQKAWGVLAAADHDVHAASRARVTELLGGENPSTEDWSAASELELRREAEGMERRVGQLKHEGKVR